MFEPVGSKVDFPKAEEKILELWKDKNIFERSLEARRDGNLFVFYEGPPTANGKPGIHHVLARVFKDVIPRYKTMKGYYVPRIAGWDTHGLPIELEVEKKLGLSSKKDIESYGIDRFNARCRESVFSYLKEWEAMTERIAFWVDLDKAYVTMRNDYIETVWWAIKAMWDKGLIYQGYKVTPHCPRCGTSLSSHEVALGYKDDIEDPSVYIKFKVAKASNKLPSDKPVYLLAWTTTPWTLPGNTALAVAADADYAVLKGEGDYLVMAATLAGVVGLEGYKAVKRLKGSDLVGVEYEPLFNPHEFGVERRHMSQGLPLQEAAKDLTYRVIATDFVSLEEGTGIVHMAPAYGEVDYEAGIEHGLDFVHTVDLQGNVIGNYPFSGKFVKDADAQVLEELDKKSLLFRSQKIRHTYPFCWRCETPLLYYAKQTWYIRTTAVKKDLIARNDEINWYPEHIKYGRFGDWLQNNVDWAFSRERYWGTPLPVWYCESCGHYECVGGVQELKDKAGFSGFKEPLDLHRPFVDELTFDCQECGAKMQRVTEVIDCWFDSGAMPIAQHHYPFENETLLEDGRFPADYISEAVDQTRGWFYSLHAIATLLFNRRCYSNVICLGHVLDAKGEKMSKAKGNMTEPWAVINKYGVDALRWYFFTSTAAGNVYRFDESMVAEVSRRFLSTLWNVYSFFVTYANIDQFVPEKEGATQEKSELDRWISSELNQLIADVDGGLGGYNPTEAGRKIEAFVDELSNWYVRRSRRRFWKSESDADKLAAYNTLYQCLVTLAKLLAPFTPFLAEAMYQNLVCPVAPDAPESVHLADFPVADKSQIDKTLAADTQLAMKISSLGRAARSQAGIKVRQPIAEVVVWIPGSRQEESLERFKFQILEELNAKDLKFGYDYRFEQVAELDGHGYAVAGVEGEIDPQKGVWLRTGPLVAVSTEIPPELLAEGVAREIVRRLQTMRRSAGFDISDHITTYYQGDDYIRQVLTDFADYIKQETLSQQLVEGVPEADAFTESHKLSGHEITLGVKRLGV
jgi:isoleucyl-tRNA synthetase